MLFADRLQKHFFNGGVMARPNLNGRWNGLRAQVEPLIGAVFNGGFNSSNWDAWANRDATFLAPGAQHRALADDRRTQHIAA